MSKWRATACLVSIFLMSGCTFTSRPDLEMQVTTKVSFGDVGKWKSGEDCASHFLGIGPFGTQSMVTAAQAGGIKKVSYFEKFTHFYLLYWKNCIVVYGR